jgi:hypothetical protein
MIPARRKQSRALSRCSRTAFAADLPHQGRGVAIAPGRIGHCVDEHIRIFEKVGSQVGQPIELLPSIAEVAEKYRDVVIRVFAGVAARPRAEQDHAFDAFAVQLIERATEAP